MIKIFSFVFALSFIWLGCGPDPLPEKQLTQKEIDQLLIDSQRAYIKKEDKMMDDYALKNSWTATKISTTGIRYSIYREGVGQTYNDIRKENGAKPIQVAIKYQSSLLDSTACYMATIDQPFIFTVGESEAISGLHELITYLREGDRVNAIIPPRLAFGLAGDLKKIPPNSPVVYDIELLQWNY